MHAVIHACCSSSIHAPSMMHDEVKDPHLIRPCRRHQLSHIHSGAAPSSLMPRPLFIAAHIGKMSITTSAQLHRSSSRPRHTEQYRALLQEGLEPPAYILQRVTHGAGVCQCAALAHLITWQPLPPGFAPRRPPAQLPRVPQYRF